MTTAAWARRPGRGRYARPEPERRLLLHHVPVEAAAPRAIHDRYIDGTTLRLRRVSDGTTTALKLTQKVRLGAGGPLSVVTTNIYLTEQEYDVLAALPAHVLTKTRREWGVGGVSCVVDELTDRWRGLVLAEVAADVPVRTDGVDVTDDERFTGAALARAGDAELQATIKHARRLLG